MHHFVVAPDQLDNGLVRFTLAQSHQITRVLRLGAGDEVVVLDGAGAQYRTVLARADGQLALAGQIAGVTDACHEPRLNVTMLVAPPRGERWEWLLQKCTEIGVARFVPIVARYSQPGSTAIKPRHREIVREATEQCRRLLMPAIAAPQKLDDALVDASLAHSAASVLLWEANDGPRPSLAAALLPAQQRGVTAIRLFIGPEGGFHADEVAQARARGITVAGLGPLILRSETAAIVAAAIALTP